MSLLELGGQSFPIPVGEVALGSAAGCAIVLAGPGILPRHALFQGQPDGQVIIRKATPAADVLINGVRLGAEPTPLLHGDKVEVGGHELTFVDERRSGSTQFVQAVKSAPAAEAGAGAKPLAVGTTGGRVVSLTDGREYVIAGQALVFGRDAGSDVVVAGKDVSRRHAEIVPTPKGYLLVDSSTNGTFVNEERIASQRLLARGDVLRIGEEQFRFYADVAAVAASPAPSAGSAAAAGRGATAPGAPAAATAAAAPAGASERLQHTMHGVPAGARVPGGAESRALASFLVRTGTLKSQRLAVRAPHANIGRADYNDLVLPDPSVSTSHAKLQRREGVWVLVDLESTNGTFIDGEAIKGEAPLAPGAVVRFGDVQLLFEPADEGLVVQKGGGTQLIRDFQPGAPPPAPAVKEAPKPAPRSPAPAPAPAPRKAPRPVPPKAPAKAGAKAPARAGPAPKPAPRPVAGRPGTPPQGEQKKGKGCGASAAVLVLVGAGLLALAHRIIS